MSFGRAHVNRKFFRAFLIKISIVIFIFSPLAEPLYVLAEQPAAINGLPAPGVRVPLSEKYRPALIKGITIYPENPLQFNAIVHQGDSRLPPDAFQQEALKMIKYFMASLTIPKEEMWVNLSPYEQGRIVPDELGITELGRDMLSQDYILKQLTASMIYPEDHLGRRFWDRVYQRVYKEFGVQSIPVNTFNKVWIVPDKAVVYEQGNTAFVVSRHLKVMLEEDYLAFRNNQDAPLVSRDPVPREIKSDISRLSADILRSIIVPEIEREVNEGKTFANLRQIYNAMILGMWFKQRLQDSLLTRVYADQNKVVGVDVEDKAIKEKIYSQYIAAYKKGVFNYIREDVDPVSQEVVPRKYFSGGLVAPARIEIKRDVAQLDPKEAREIQDVVSSSIQYQGFIVRALELSSSEAEHTVQAMLKQAEGQGAGKRIAVIEEVRELLSRGDMADVGAIRKALEPFKGNYFYDLVYGYGKDSLVIERGQELWLVVQRESREKNRLYRYMDDSDQKKADGNKDIRAVVDIPNSRWQIVRIRKGELAQDKLIDLQLIEDNGFRVIDLKEDAGTLEEEDIGRGLEKARERVIAELDYNDYLDSFFSRLKGKTVLNRDGERISLFIKDTVRNKDDLLQAFEEARNILNRFDENARIDDVYAALREAGLERGWGASLSEIKSRINMLLESARAGDAARQKRLLMDLDLRTPTALSAVFVSTHGWFVQENAFGKPDTGGQVSFVRDEARAMAKEMAGKMAEAGIPGKAVALIFTRQIPQAEDTNAFLDEESVYEDESQVVKIVRVPFEGDGSPRETRGRPRPKNILEVVQAFIRRFEIWSYITQDKFIRASGAKITEVISRYGPDKPDLIMGNYSDGNLLAGKLSDYYGGNVPVVMTAHALELSKYFKSMLQQSRLIDNWFETEDGRYLAAQALIDAWVMRKADIIETSTLIEILGQYSYYEAFEFENLYRVENGLTLTDEKFVLNEPSVDQRTDANPRGLFFAYDGPEDARREEFSDANALWQAKIFGKPDARNKVFDRFGDWQNKDKPVIFTMARFDSRKNIAGLVEEFAKAGLKDRANLVLVGGNTDYFLDEDGRVVFKSRDGSDDMNAEELAIAHKILELVDQYGLAGHIRWISASTVARESAELYRVMNDHPEGAIFAQPAIFEAFGLTILEAMVTKLLVVATDQGGPAEIIRPDQDGFLANPDQPGMFGAQLSAALDVLNAPEKRERVLASALERIRNKYSWQRRVRRTLQAAKYFSALNDARRIHQPLEWQARQESREQVYQEILNMVDKLAWTHQLEYIPPEDQPEMEAAASTRSGNGSSSPILGLSQRMNPTEDHGGTNYGGIDLNSDFLDLQIKRDDNGVPLPLYQQPPLQELRIEGFMPIIIDVVPVRSPLSGTSNDKNSATPNRAGGTTST